MALKTYSGRVADAVAFARRTIHVAWGTGKPWWHETFTEEHTFGDDGQFQLGHAPVATKHIEADKTVLVFELRAGNGTVYRPDDDYYVIAATGMVIRAPQSTIPNGATVTATYKAAPDYLTGLETALVNEVGRRRALPVQFIAPDEAGTIGDPDKQRWSVTPEPTHNLLVNVTFDFDENPDAVIRELGVFVDTVAHESIPPGQDYLRPDEIADPGYLHTIENLDEPVIRSALRLDGAYVFITF